MIPVTAENGTVDVSMYTVSLQAEYRKSAIYCRDHGKTYFAYHLTPRPDTYLVAQYACAHCVTEKMLHGFESQAATEAKQ